MNLITIVEGLLKNSGYATMTWQQLVMLVLSFILMYPATVKQFEPLLLLPTFFGIFMSDLPHFGTFEYFYRLDYRYDAGILGVMYMGVKPSFFPCTVLLAVGATTDFGPLITNPIPLLLDAAAQLGIYCVSIFVDATGPLTPQQAAAIGIIGGVDGPTAICVANNPAPELVAPVAVVAYSYMTLTPLIQPPIMNLLTTDRERRVKMKQLRRVSKAEKIVFPIPVAYLVSLFLPDAAPLSCILMLDGLFRKCDVVERLSDVAQNALCNICTILPGLSVGATARGEPFLRSWTLTIVIMGPAASSFSTFGGVAFGKVLYAVTGGKIDPFIGSVDVSAAPMAARVSQAVGFKTDGANFLLMYAMGPNTTGAIGFAAAVGFSLAFFAH